MILVRVNNDVRRGCSRGTSSEEDNDTSNHNGT